MGKKTQTNKPTNKQNHVVFVTDVGLYLIIYVLFRCGLDFFFKRLYFPESTNRHPKGNVSSYLHHWFRLRRYSLACWRMRRQRCHRSYTSAILRPRHQCNYEHDITNDAEYTGFSSYAKLFLGGRRNLQLWIAS